MKNDKDRSDSGADFRIFDYHRTITDEERAEMMALRERMRSEPSESARIACRKKVAELEALLKPIESELYRFEHGELLRGNPAAIAGRPPADWGLPPEMEALYDRHWELTLWLSYIGSDVWD
jgi:hypothetical protein